MQHKVFGLILTSALIATSTLTSLAGEVELFIPEHRAKQILQEEKETRLLEQRKKYNNFKYNAMAMTIHENDIDNKVEDVVTLGGAVIIDEGVEISKATFNDSKNPDKANAVEINDNNLIHENSISPSSLEIASTQTPKTAVKIHENAVEFSNFIVHENSLKSRYNEEIMSLKVPDEEKVWTAAASQATLLFSASAKERDQATKELINNGGWLNVANKLLASNDNKVRINGIQLIKSAVFSQKYSNVSTEIKVKKLSQLLITSLNDNDSKVRFISALVLSKLTGDNFNYDFNSDPISRQESISAWNTYIQNSYGS